MPLRCVKSNAKVNLHSKRSVFKNVVWAPLPGVGPHWVSRAATRITTAASFAECSWAESLGFMPQCCFKSNANVYGKQGVFKREKMDLCIESKFPLSFTEADERKLMK